MGLTALTLHNYRSFAAPTRVAVRPLTLVFGRNSAGKSALLRALPLLAASFHEGRMLNPLAMGCEAMREATFRDLLCQVGGPHSAMDIGLTFDAGPTETSLRVRLLEDSRKRHFVERFWLSSGDDARVRGQWRLGEPLDHFDLTGTFGPDTLQAQGTVHPFAPVVPQVHPSDARWAAPMRDVFSRVQQFAAHCQWLGSLRTVPARRRRFPLTRPTQYGASGDALLDTLAWDTREEAELPHLVSAWYEKHFQMRLRVTDGEPGGESFRLRLGPVDAAHDVDVCDTGEGMAQALPVVTALYQSALASAEGAQTLALEQPELHLLLDAQHALADLLCEIASRPNAPTVLIETHSEAMLVALQLAIATGRLAPERVLVHVVRALADGSSVVDAVEFDALGQPHGAWPHDMFRRVIDDARALSAARRSARAK